jgi:hypothetical protein
MCVFKALNLLSRSLSFFIHFHYNYAFHLDWSLPGSDARILPLPDA